jgi:hypothetical protein
VGGSGAAAGWGTEAWVSAAPEAVGRAAAGPLRGPEVAVYWEKEAGEEPLCTAQSWGPEKEPGAGAPPEAGELAGGPTGRDL